MKKFYALIIFILSISSLSQANDDTIYFNSHWEISSKRNSNYFRIFEFDSENICYKGEVIDYLPGGDKEMTGFYKDGKKDSAFNFYFPNSRLKLEINFDNGIKNGEWREYYFDGNLKKYCIYHNNLEFIIEVKLYQVKTTIKAANSTMLNYH